MPIYSEETIRRVAEANDIVDIIGSRIPLQRTGGTYKARCPFHVEKTASFNVNPQKQMFHCFGCKAGGSVFRFLMDFESIDFPAAVRKLAERAGLPLPEESASPEEAHYRDQRTRLLTLHEQAAEWFHLNLMKKSAGGPARDYLASRGLTADIAREWRLGHAPDSFGALTAWAEEQRFPPALLALSGLAKTRDDAPPRAYNDLYDRFRHRLMFPICNESGEVVAFSGRTLGADKDIAKYINSPETPIFTKGAVLFGLHKTRKEIIRTKQAIVCEGQIDLISAHHAGIPNIIAPQGTAFTERQARILRRHCEEVVLCFDADSAGQQATERSLPALLAQDILVRVAGLPPGQDPDSLIRSEGADAFRQRIADAPNFFDHQIARQATLHDLATPRGRRDFALKIAALAVPLQNPSFLDDLVYKVCSRTGLAAEDFRQMLAEARRSRPSFNSGETNVNSAAPRPVSSTTPDLRSGPENSATPVPSPAPAPRKLSNDIAFLCTLALRHAESLQELREYEWEPVLDQTLDGDLLARVLRSDVDPDHPASVNAFLSTLPPADESALGALLQPRFYTDPARVLRDSWNRLRIQILQTRLAALKSRTRLPGLSDDEIAQMQTDIIRLHREIQEISRS